MYACVCAGWLQSCPTLMLWTVALQAPLSMGFSRHEYWSGSPLPSPGDLPDPGIEARPSMSSALARGSFNTGATWEAQLYVCVCVYTHVHMYVYIHTYTHMHTHIYTCICMCVHVYVYMCVHVYMSVCYVSYIFLDFLSLIGYYKILSRVPCAIQ